ncbi:MAG: hypothetical protein U0935_23350 [Pirellulales bacterium]
MKRSTRSSARSTITRTRRCRIEPLERRTVLAVECDVTCEVVGDQLRILGSADDDVIEIRFDTDTSRFRVLGDGVLAGEFSLDEIRYLRVEGLGGNDHFAIDSSLPLQLLMDGGEGEDQLAVATTSFAHPHDPTRPLSAVVYERNIESVAVVPGSSLTNSNVTGSGNDGSRALALLASLSLSHGHSGYSADDGAAGELSHAGTGHVGGSSSAVSSTGVTTIAHDEHSGGTSPYVITGNGDRATGLDGTELAAGRAQAATGHHGSSVSRAKGVELAKKWCTTTPLANRLVTTLEGKPTCSCEEPKPKADRAAGASGAPGSSAARADGGELACLPCGQQNPWDAILADLQNGHFCSDKSADDLVASLSAQFASPRRGVLRESEAWSEESSWVDQLQWVGWGLVAAGIYVAPLLLKKSRSEEAEEDQAVADSWQRELLNFT